MRTGKRTLAGLAAGALALGLIPFVPGAAANAAEVTAGVTPARVTFAGATTLESVPYATVYWSASAAISNTDTATVTLTAAPNSIAKVALAKTSVVGTTSGYTSVSGATFSGGSGYATAFLGSPSGSVAIDDTFAQGATAYMGIAADTPGTYAGVITLYRSGAATGETVKFSFTTVGRATSMKVTPASSSTTQLGSSLLTVGLFDAGGNPTQPLAVDAVAVSPTAGNVTYPASLGGGAATSLSAANLSESELTLTYTAPNYAGTQTVTFTPGGTLPTGGVTTQTASITVGGTVSDDTVSNLTVATPATAVNSGTLAAGTRAAVVPTGSSSVVVNVTGGAVNAGKTIRLKSVASAGTLNGSTTLTQYQNLTADASGNATATYALGGTALAANATLTVTQVNASNADINVGANAAKITVTQTNPVVDDTSISESPTGRVLAKLGDTVPWTVTVKNQFGEPVSGWQVTAYRSATAGSGTVIGIGTTNASGQVVLNVSGAAGIVSGTVEQYSLRAQIGSTQVDMNNKLQVEYTTSGGVTSMSVTVTGGAQTPITNGTTSITSMPNITVPYTGVVTTQSSKVFTVATASVGAAGTVGQYATFAATPNPANAVTVTVPEGLKLFTDAQFAAASNSLAWSAGATTLTVASGANVNVFGTKAGIHDVTFTSGAVTTVAKVRVASTAAAAYNIALSPATQNLQPGAFGTATLTVTDAFSNPVPLTVASTATPTGGVVASASGEVLLSGLNASQALETGADGKATITLIAGKTGAGTVTAVPQVPTGQQAPAWVPTYSKPTGFPDPVRSATIAVTVTQSSAKSITITGSRTTVSGKPGIKIDGAVSGIENGKTVIPYFRFPGETTFAQGSARPVIEGGKFTWQRKTGKKFYAYVTSDDGAVTSNRVIIPAN